MSDSFESKGWALLVVDVQNYFFQEGSPAYLTESAEILPKINSLVEFTAGSGRPVIFTSHHAPSVKGNLMEAKWRRLPRGEECTLYPGLSVPEGSEHLRKERYSAFLGTKLAEILRRYGAKSVVICGVMTHLCVDTTARHAFMLGWRPIVVADACCSKSLEYHRAALLALGHGFAEIVNARELLEDPGRYDSVVKQAR